MPGWLYLRPGSSALVVCMVPNSTKATSCLHRSEGLRSYTSAAQCADWIDRVGTNTSRRSAMARAKTKFLGFLVYMHIR